MINLRRNQDTKKILSNTVQLRENTENKKKSMKRSKSTGWLNLVPRQPSMIEIDPFDGQKTISIGERVVVLEDEEAEILQDLDRLLSNV